MERSLESQGPFDLAKLNLTRRLESERGEIQPCSKRALPSSQPELSRASCALANGWCIMRFDMLKDKNFHPVSVRTSLPCLFALTEPGLLACSYCRRSLWSAVPQHLSRFCCRRGYALTSLLPRAESSAGGRVLSQARRDQNVWTLPTWLYLMILNFNWGAILGI